MQQRIMCEMCQQNKEIEGEEINKICQTCKDKVQRNVNKALEEDIWTEGYDVDLFVNKLAKYYECALCLQAHRDPVQIVGCGHVFCQSCLENATGNQEKKMCPIDRNEFSIQMSDISMKRMIMDLAVKCKSDQCSWQGVLGNLEEHFQKVCEHIVIKCTNDQCEEKMKKSDLITHLRNCLFRPFECSSCQQSVFISQLQGHHDSKCQLIPVECTLGCKEKFPRNQLDVHTKNCDFRLVKCTFSDLGCSFEGRKESRDAHFVDYSSFHLDLSMKKIGTLEDKILQNNEAHRAEMVGLRKEHEEMIALKLNEIEEMISNRFNAQSLVKSRETGRINKRFSELDRKHAALDRNKVSCFKRLDEQERQQKSFNLKLVDHSVNQAIWNRECTEKYQETVAKVCDIETSLKEMNAQNSYLNNNDFQNVFIWRIDNFQKKLQDAKDGNVAYFFSPLFHYKRYAYKMLVYPNGEGASQNKCFALYFQLEVGEFDAVLEWPFIHPITLSVISQRKGVPDKARAMIPAGESEFKKPDDNTNARGFLDFLPHAEIEDFVKNECMFIRCSLGFQLVN